MTAQPECALRIVTVCTMNICRSPAMATVLDRNLAGTPELTIQVSSAGTEAEPGLARCGLAQALIGIDEPTGHAQALPAGLIVDVDLILTADSGHRGRVVLSDPAARTRTFTLLEAARLATWVVGPDGTLELAQAKAAGESLGAEPDELRALTDPLPSDDADRIKWLIVEMEAARGLTPLAANRFGYLRVDAIGPDDIPDPHVLGYGLHQETTAAIVAAAESWVGALNTVLSR